jgi:RNA-directed DNA polymerase
MGAWLNFFGTSCTEAAMSTLHNLAAHIRRRLRALLIRQWKRKRFIVRRLIRLGARASKAWHVVYAGRKSLWALSHRSSQHGRSPTRILFVTMSSFCMVE